MSKTEITSQVEWKNVNWRKAEFAVFKLQKRIYRASQRGDVQTVRRLQKSLAQSWSAKLIAVRRVTQDNKGRVTAGVDGIKSLKPPARLELAKNLKVNGKSAPTRRVWIPKPGKPEKRGLGIPTIEERAKQTLIKLALEPEWEARFESESYGFRPGRSCHDAVEAIRTYIAQKPKYVLDADICRCFDKINHTKLLEKLNTFPIFERQIKAWLKAGVIDFSRWAQRKGFQETLEGVPQGGSISPLLTNIALHGMQQRIEAQFPSDKANRIRNTKRLFGKEVKAPTLIRYADDLVVICEELAVVQQCQQILSEWLSELGLELKPEKTRLVHTLEEHGGEKPGFNFLGFSIRQYPVGKHHSGETSKGKKLGFKTIVKPSNEKLQAHYRKLDKYVEENNSSSQAALISFLNPIIRGWCHYQSPWNSKETFNKLDHLLWSRLYRWGKRRHPNKGKKWVARKYWRTIGHNNWVFASSRKEQDSFNLLLHAAFPAGLRWKKVQGTRSPYDGDSIYWSARMGENYKYLEPQKARLLKRQKGRCAQCGLNFNPGDSIEKHHLKPRAKGGNNADKNLILVHLHCHDQIHGQSETEPR
ncbi:reverse transcriptase domain-containing protein [Microcoleus sp. F10-C6]|uniref:reverse transcriptase domain-containing protein n=1 Tax=unclassified Microcoleus TaxID=2642155 RepID=UPI002FD79EAD